MSAKESDDFKQLAAEMVDNVRQHFNGVVNFLFN